MRLHVKIESLFVTMKGFATTVTRWTYDTRVPDVDFSLQDMTHVADVILEGFKFEVRQCVPVFPSDCFDNMR